MKKAIVLKKNPVHVKFEYFEALDAKKMILETEMGMLNAIKYMDRYRKLRNEETKIRLRLKKELRELGEKIRIITLEFPLLEIQRTQEKEKISHPKKHTKEESLENELEEIKLKLNHLVNKKI